MRRLLAGCAALFFLAVATVAMQPARGLVIDGGEFRFKGKPLQIISGEMHYARIPPEYWRDRLKKARAMGLNTISTYVFWNFHEASPGEYDFSGPRDIARYIRTAQEEGLHVILRPGPYVCAEWELGGYPGWLFADPGIVLRSTDPKFTAPAAKWLDRLGRELAPLLVSRGGPIMAVQVENEYGSFDKDKAYLAWQLDALRHAGFGDALLYTADGGAQLPNGTLPDLPAVVNFGAGGAEGSFTRLAAFRPGAPLMSGEYWAGWFDQWGGRHAKTNADQQTRELTWMLDRGYSVNLYMFHGGTTFGFMNGANIDRGQYHPQTTSYDYDSALDESGRPTPKYFAFRDAIAKRTGETPPPVPETPAPIEVPAFTLGESVPLWSTLGQRRPPEESESASAAGRASGGGAPRATKKVDRPRPMETFGQSYGYILYRTTVTGPEQGELVVGAPRDYVQVYVNGALAGTLDRRFATTGNALDRIAVTIPAGSARLDILVENTGRVNFNKALLEERKGITGPVTLGGRELTGWDVFTLPMSSMPAPRFAAAGAAVPDGPAFYRGSFDLSHPADTFLDTRGWGKGTVWINGHHLGRFWSIGPQQTLYVPGPWLRSGRNDVVVFDLERPQHVTMAGLTAPVLDQVR